MLRPLAGLYHWRYLLLSMVFFPLIHTVHAQSSSSPYSVIWGNKGDNWDTSRLRDFSNVGYKQGEEPIPNWDASVSVTDPQFGAVGNGVHDDTEAFNKAIALAPPESAVIVPNGTYVITDYINFDRDDVVLRGESRNKTILYFPKGLRDIYGLEDENGKAYRWQFDGGFLRSEGRDQVGLENFTIKFSELQFETHFSTTGTNAIQFVQVTNSWMRSLLILNANAGIGLRGSRSRYNTILDIEFDAYDGRTSNDYVNEDGKSRNGGFNAGHSAIKVKDGQFNLLHNILYSGGPYVHSLNINGARNNVFSRFRGSNLQLDWHGGPMSGNLWTEWRIGSGEKGKLGRPNFSGAGVNEVLWNITSERSLFYCNEFKITRSGPKFQGADCNSNNVVVGLGTEHPTDITEEYWHEKIDPQILEPQNLYVAQLEYFEKDLPKSFVPSNTDIGGDGDTEELCFPISHENENVSLVCL